MGRVRGRVFPDVTFGAEIEGYGWVDHAWMEAGLPTCRWNGAPGGLATRRQLRELGLSPGGHPPVAALRRHPGGYLHAWLYRMDLAGDKRNATPAVLRALGAAMRARRTCPTCRRDTGCCLPRSLGQCWDCWAAREGVALSCETTPARRSTAISRRAGATKEHPSAPQWGSCTDTRPGGHPAKNAHRAGAPNRQLKRLRRPTIMDQHTATGRVPVHPDHAETRYALTVAGHAALTPAGAPPPAVMLCCTDCDLVYEPTTADLAAGRAGCPDPDCGGWTFSTALTEPATGGAR